MPAKTNQSIIDLAREYYRWGLSIRQVAKMVGFNYGTVGYWVKDIRRCKSLAAILRVEPKSVHWRSSRAAARKKMERHLGYKLEFNEIVHHLNDDYTDNRLSNLTVLNRSDHSRMHNIGRNKKHGG